MSERAHEGWLIAAAGADTSRRFEAPVELPGEMTAWVEVRPLTAREALQREANGLEEEYELGEEGAARKLRRRYEHEAMVGFELERCLVAYELPMSAEDGRVKLVGPSQGLDLLERLPAALMAWLMECLDTVNLRRPADAAVLAEGKDG